MQPTFGEYDEGWGAVLNCPLCEGDHSHHDKVEVFERAEDATVGLHVQIENGKAEIDGSLDGNPSSRRHGVSIRFWCETCGGISLLTIAQHKGVTLVDFIDTGEKTPEQ